MYSEKEANLQIYYHLTLKLVNELDEAAADLIQALLDERQSCIEKVNQLDQAAGKFIKNQAIQELLQRISPLEAILQEKLHEQKQKVLANIHSLKKEKNIKQHYGEPAFASSGLFYDKRK